MGEKMDKAKSFKEMMRTKDYGEGIEALEEMRKD